MHDKQAQTLAPGVDPGGDHRCRQLGPGQMLSAFKRLGHDLDTPSQGGLVELGPAVVLGVELLDARARQPEDPADVGRVQEVPGRAQGVGPDDSTLVEGGIDVGLAGSRSEALADAPRRARIVLRLDRAESADDVLRGGEARPEQAAGVEAACGDDGVGHAAGV